jgi:hypothetical protein
VGIDEELTQPAAGVVAHQGDVVQIECTDEFVDHLGDRTRGQRCRRVDGNGVRAQRQVGKYASETLARQLFCDLHPEAMVDEDAVDEEHRGMG